MRSQVPDLHFPSQAFGGRPYRARSGSYARAWRYLYERFFFTYRCYPFSWARNRYRLTSMYHDRLNSISFTITKPVYSSRSHKQYMSQIRLLPDALAKSPPRRGPTYREIVQTLISYTWAMGCFSDFVWYELISTDRMGILRS